MYDVWLYSLYLRIEQFLQFTPCQAALRASSNRREEPRAVCGVVGECLWILYGEYIFAADRGEEHSSSPRVSDRLPVLYLAHVRYLVEKEVVAVD